MGIKENLDRVLEEIAAAARISGRDAESVKLLAVSKFHPQEAVREALSCGQFLFGENRVQEAELKFSGLNGEFPRLRLHLIGTLQRNKVKRILPLVSCIQSLDRLELLLEIEKRAAECGKEISVLFELHTGEESKSGYADLSSLFASIDALEFCPHVRCRGLMTMALPALMEIRHLYITVEVGLVDGISAATTPIGTPTSMIPFAPSSRITPTVFISLM